MLESDFWFEIDNLRKNLVASRQFQGENGMNPSSVINSSAFQHKSRKQVLEKIQDITLDCINSISRGEPPSINFANRHKWENVSFDVSKGIEMKENTKNSSVKFSSANSTKRLALILHVMAKIYFLVQTDTKSTKREIYYQDVSLYGSQATLNSIIEDISCLLKVPRRDLHIMATSKGCIAGNLRFRDADGNYIDCSESSNGILVPTDIESINYIASDAKFVLVVEKDATFQKLLDENITFHLNPCIIITGKGFPDVNTREMVHKLWEVLQIPILALVDANPHGIEILCIYRFGSLSLSHDSSRLTVPCLKWLGVHPTDMERLRVPKSALVPLGKSDIDKAKDLLKRVYIQGSPEWEHQIKFIMEYKKKAEIQSLCSISHKFLCEVYLPAKIRLGGWI